MPAETALARPCDSAPLSEPAISLRTLQLVFSSRPMSVRDALTCVLGVVSGLNLPRGASDSLQIALAELLNNVVEHAHGECGEGRVELHLSADASALTCTVFDDGVEMPGGRLPSGHDDWSLDSLADLPEGGFGWFLIRQEVEDLRYVRDGTVNRVSFRLPFG